MVDKKEVMSYITVGPKKLSDAVRAAEHEAQKLIKQGKSDELLVKLYILASRNNILIEDIHNVIDYLIENGRF